MAGPELWEAADPGDPATIPPYDRYLDQDSHAVPAACLDRGDPLPDLPVTLPPSWWTSPEVHRLEIERLWGAVWQSACRANDVPRPGDAVRHRSGDGEVLIVRGADGAIRAVWASCRHRGTLLGPDAVSPGGIHCPAHGWGYDHDGHLRAVPCRWDFGDHDLDTLSLPAVPVAVWDGWVFIDPGGRAGPFERYLDGRVSAHFARWSKAGLRKRFHLGRVVAANWKLLVNAFSETYHFARTHPELRPVASELSAALDVFGEHARIIVPQAAPSLQVGPVPRRADVARAWLGDDGDGGGETPLRTQAAGGIREQGAARGRDLSGFCDAELVDAIQYFVFPNFFPWGGPTPTMGGGFRFRPWGDELHALVEVFGLAPDDPGDGAAGPGRDEPLRILDAGETFDRCPELAGMLTGRILEQDIAVAEGMQQGLPALDEVRLGRSQERLLAHFYDRLARRLGSPAPRPRAAPYPPTVNRERRDGHVRQRVPQVPGRDGPDQVVTH